MPPCTTNKILNVPQWEKEHEKMTCEEFAAFKNESDQDNQVEKHLAEGGVTCPKCHQRSVSSNFSHVKNVLPKRENFRSFDTFRRIPPLLRRYLNILLARKHRLAKAF